MRRGIVELVNKILASYDVAPDGRFLMVRPDTDRPISVILNWSTLLRRPED